MEARDGQKCYCQRRRIGEGNLDTGVVNCVNVSMLIKMES